MTQNPSNGRFIWHDLMSTDPEKAAGFYSELFGYTVTEEEVPPGQTYRKLHVGELAAGGIVPLDPQGGIPSHWMSYIAVDDVQAAIDKIKELGGQTHFGPIDVPGKAAFAIHGDAQGGAFTTMKPAEPASMPHCTPDNVQPGMVCWDELWTSDADAAVNFYGALCGWTSDAKDMGEFVYNVQMIGTDMVCGIMKAPDPNMPSYWCPYLFAPDVDDRTQRASDLGAQVVVPCTDIPGTGRFSVLTDPTGACFSLFQAAGEC